MVALVQGTTTLIQGTITFVQGMNTFIKRTITLVQGMQSNFDHPYLTNDRLSPMSDHLILVMTTFFREHDQIVVAIIQGTITFVQQVIYLV